MSSILPPTIDGIRNGMDNISRYITGHPSLASYIFKMPDSERFTGVSGKFGKNSSDLDVGLSNIRRDLNSLKGLSTTGSGSGASTAQQFDYYYADLAKRYGMNRETAYNEAMSNTAYQRAVADMQAAGLNPAVMLSSGRASGASAPYAQGAYTSASGGSKSDNSIPGWLYYGATALAQAVGTAATKSFYGGFAIGQTAQNILRALNNK